MDFSAKKVDEKVSSSMSAVKKATNGESLAKDGALSEADLVRQRDSGRPIRAEDVLRLDRVTESYLCEPEANVYGLDFTRFKIRDVKTGATLFEISKPPGGPAPGEADPHDPNVGRFVRYQFTPEFLKLKTVGATVEWCTGPRAIKEFRMIERHFFKDRHLKTFDFNFGFCVPDSKNSCEQIYEFPKLDGDTIKAMINEPFATRWEDKNRIFLFHYI